MPNFLLALQETKLETAAGLITSPDRAMLIISLDEFAKATKIIYIDGGDLNKKEQSYDYGNVMADKEDMLYHIDATHIMRALSNPKAKHASFRKSGNCFSRIAYLIQQGYEGIKGVQPQPSGVRFRWTQNDLLKYAAAWTSSQHVLGGRGGTQKQGDQWRGRDIGAVERIYYTFTSDTTVTVTTGAQKKAIEDAVKKAAQERGSSEPGKRMISF